MDRIVVMDLMSELYMLTQGGIELLGVAASRAHEADRATYIQFRESSMKLRDQTVKAIRQVGGDPEYVAPVARMAQFTAERMMSAALVLDGLTPEQIHIVDLEYTITAATQSLNHWKLLTPKPGTGVVAKAAHAVGAAIESLTGKEEEGPQDHQVMAVFTPLAMEAVGAMEGLLTWAQKTWEDKNRQMMENGLDIPEGWLMATSGPHLPVHAFTPAPVEEGLLEGAKQPMWTDSSLTRLAKAGF